MPTNYEEIIQAAAVNYDVPVSLIKAVIATESNWNPNAVRHERLPDGTVWDTSRGLMQILFRTAVSLGFPNDPSQADKLFDPAINIDYGTRLLARLMRQYEYVDDIYAAYNAGKVYKNAQGLYTNSHGDTAVQTRVDRFMQYWARYEDEEQEKARALAETESETKGAAVPGAIAAALVVAIFAMLFFKR